MVKILPSEATCLIFDISYNKKLGKPAPNGTKKEAEYNMHTFVKADTLDEKIDIK
jgi:hypothetical protein